MIQLCATTNVHARTSLFLNRPDNDWDDERLAVADEKLPRCLPLGVMLPGVDDTTYRENSE